MVEAHASPGKFPEQGKGNTRDKLGAYLGCHSFTQRDPASQATPGHPSAARALGGARAVVYS